MTFQTLSAADLRDPAISDRIATRMKEFHGLEMPGVKKALLWDRLRYISLLSAKFYYMFFSEIIKILVFLNLFSTLLSVTSEIGSVHARDWLHQKKLSPFVSMLWRWKLIRLRNLSLTMMKILDFATMIYSMET